MPSGLNMRGRTRPKGQRPTIERKSSRKIDPLAGYRTPERNF